MEIQTEERVQVRFTVKAPDGTTFTDALYMTAEERAATDDKAITAAADARYQAWQKAVQDARDKPPYVPTPEEEAKMLEALLIEQKRAEEELAKADPEKVAAARERLGIPEKADPKAPAEPVKGELGEAVVVKGGQRA